MAPYKALLSLSLLLLTLPAFALTNYEAAYHVKVRGVPAGTMQYQATFTPDSYSITTKGQPSLAAKMLGFGLIHETARGSVSDGEVQPSSYQRDMDGKPKYHLFYAYHPDEHFIQAEIGREKKILHYHADVRPLDTLAMVVQSLLDLEKGAPASVYTMLGDDHIRTYRVQQLPDAHWETKAGKIVQIKVFRQTNGNRETKVFFAEDPLRLVKLEQLKSGSMMFVLTLTDYKTLE